MVAASLLLVFFGLVGCSRWVGFGTNEPIHTRYWPIQEVPKALIEVPMASMADLATGLDGGQAVMLGHHLTQSLSGLAARGVNEGRFDALVWIDTGGPHYPEWKRRIKARHGIETRAVMDPWQLLAELRRAGLVRGYVLYDAEFRQAVHAPETTYPEVEDLDHSVNVATIAAGVLDAVLIESRQEARARAMGLLKVYDARGRNEMDAFHYFKGRLSNQSILAMPPHMPQNRAMAVAHRFMVTYGVGENYDELLQWVEPPAPILGWNFGDEAGHVRPATRYGHFQTASNWCLNLPALSAGSHLHDPRHFLPLDPRTINYDDGRAFHSFIMSDGDNLQWMTGNFVNNESYWGHPAHGELNTGWTICMAHLAQAAPVVIDALVESEPLGVSLSEHCGGYQYPDLFAEARPNRKELITQHARMVSAQMQHAGGRVFSFITQDIDSEAALEAYRIYAREIEGLTGMIAFQYYPYDGGDGEIYWLPNKDGVDIPVLCVKYSIWANASWDRGGGPDKIAGLFNDYVRDERSAGRKAYGMTAVHAWSRFMPPDEPGGEVLPLNENEATPEELQASHRGLDSIIWTAERLDPGIRVITPEEMLWRLRMEHRPEETRRILDNMPQ